jgi:hypothetical protein
MHHVFNFKGWMGWWALILIAVLIGLAQFLGQHVIVRRALWTAAAVVAAVAAFNEWRAR